MRKPGVTIELVDKLGPYQCHRGHAVGDSFDFDSERGELCPMAMHVLFPYIDIIRCGGSIPPGRAHGDIRICCPDADVANVFKLHVESAEPLFDETFFTQPEQ